MHFLNFTTLLFSIKIVFFNSESLFAGLQSVLIRVLFSELKKNYPVFIHFVDESTPS